MPRLELSVRNASALAANFAGRASRVQRAARRVVRDSYGEPCRELTQVFCPVDTGFLQKHVRTVYSPDGLVAEVGWDVMDFVEAGLAFYPVFQEYGWHDRAGRFHPGVYMLTRAHKETLPPFRRDLSDAIRAATRGRG